MTKAKLLAALQKRIAPELNHLLTTPPFERSDGFDCGWFCLEHAYATFLVSTMCGASSKVVRGDFVVRPKGRMRGISSLHDSSDHAWCKVEEHCPVDLSMTFRHFGDGPCLRKPVMKTGSNGDFTLIYTRNESRAESAQPGEIILLERELVAHEVESLLKDPYLLIHQPNTSDPASWHNLYGPGIYPALALHCYFVARKETKMLKDQMTPSDAVASIGEQYLTPTEQIEEILAQKPTLNLTETY